MVTGLSWSRGARKLLVTYRHRAVLAPAHLCKWDMASGLVEAHCKWCVSCYTLAHTCQSKRLTDP